jgi:hypothetical protein
MRFARIALALAALSLVVAACGDDDATTTTVTTVAGGATTTPTTAGSTGGTADGSIVFQISGGYERSGEFEMVPEASVFSNGGWSATFGGDDGESVISVNTIPGNFAVLFGDANAVVTGGELLGCSFELSQNDASGFAGTFSCDNIGAFTGTGTAITVDFSGSFSS